MGKAQSDFLNVGHMDWLVISRCNNQSSSLDIYRIYAQYADQLNQNHVVADIVQGLTAINFSLWRAVFLRDVQSENQDLMKSAELFLENLVLHNTVSYFSDYRMRAWTFNYYMNNAAHRFRAIRQINGYNIVPDELDLDSDSYAPSELWTIYQNSLNISVRNIIGVLKLFN